MALSIEPIGSFFTASLRNAGDALSPLHSVLRPSGGNLDSKNLAFKSDNNGLIQSSQERDSSEASCSNCSHFAAVARSFVAEKFAQTFQRPLNSVKEQSVKHRGDTLKILSLKKKGLVLPLELFPFHVLDDLGRSALQLFDHDFLIIIDGIIKGRKADFDGFLSNMKFARVGGMPGLISVAPAVKGKQEDSGSGSCQEEEPILQRIANVLLSISVASIERFRSTLSAVSVTELVELVPQLGQSSKVYPDKKKLFSVQDFFRYSKSEGKKFFEELDRDGDGQVTLDDLEIAMRKKRLPRRYARKFLHCTRKHLFCKSIGWKQFLSLMEQKEPVILRAYTSLCLSKSGTLQKTQILTSLRSAGLPANEENAIAMMRYLNAETRGPISYSHFRNFMLLLPSERLEDDPRNIWFEAATVVSVLPPVKIAAGSVLKSALAGGLACALSTSVMHPIDTMKAKICLSCY